MAGRIGSKNGLRVEQEHPWLRLPLLVVEAVVTVENVAAAEKVTGYVLVLAPLAHSPPPWSQRLARTWSKGHLLAWLTLLLHIKVEMPART